MYYHRTTRPVAREKLGAEKGRHPSPRSLKKKNTVCSNIEVAEGGHCRAVGAQRRPGVGDVNKLERENVGTWGDAI